MRTRDIAVGETYWVEVPHTLPTHRYHPRDLGLEHWLELVRLRGSRFVITVTDITASPEPVVEGVRVVDNAHFEIVLTPEQVAAAGLAQNVPYRLVGRLYDDADELVALPHASTIQVPARWLHPLDGPQSPTHHDADTMGL